MGICASCLGLNRHPSRTGDETDALLDTPTNAQYGSLEHDEVAQPDEEELRREREALEQITAEAADNMIDVSHPTNPDHRAHGNASEPTDDGEEAAWLQSIQSAELDTAGEVKGLRSGALVMDMSQLRA